MRVLHIVESFATGVLNVVELLANGARQLDADVHIAFSRRLETPADFACGFDEGVHFHELDLARGLDLRKDLKGIAAIFRLMRQLKPDVVHLHSSKAGFLGRLAWRVARLLGQQGRLFYSPHGFSFLQENLGKGERFAYLSLERLAYVCGGTVVGCSEGEGDVARDKLGRRRIAVVENAIADFDLPKAEYSRRLPVRVVTAGRISYQKNPGLFAKMAAAFDGVDAEFVWVGTTAAGQEQLASELGSRVRVTGWLPRQQALREIAAGDIYLQTSRWEGMPISVIEAMMMGLPVVVSDVVGNRDTVTHGATGFVFKNEQDGVTQLARLVRDAELRSEIGRQAATHARSRFSERRFIAEWAALYGLTSSVPKNIGRGAAVAGVRAGETSGI